MGNAAPNITPDPETGIGRWSVDDIVTLLTDGQKPDFDFVGGAMGEIVNDTSRLSDADRRAIAVYLKSLPPIASPKKDRAAQRFDTGRSVETSYDGGRSERQQ